MTSTHSIADDDIVATLDDVRPGAREPLVVTEPLYAFLDEHGLGSGEATFAPVGDGHSNVTFRVDRGDARFVLRRPPRGPLPPSAHDVAREARLLRALGPTDARTVDVLASCDDDSIIGAPFYCMNYVDGYAISGEMPPELDTPADRRRIGEELIDALVEIHAVDYLAAGLEGFGKPDGYTARQIRRFSGLWEHNKTREVPQVERVAEWLGNNLPDSPAATIVHGDFRLGNTMVSLDSPPSVLAVVDWEMATIGDPLADIGYMTALWTEASDPPLGMFEYSVTRAEGWPTRDELIARYEERSGRSVADIRWYRTLALWKSVIFMEGNYKRAVTGATDDPYLKGFEQGVPELADRAEAMARGDV